MTPELGKWYNIKYGNPNRGKRAYHGVAKCLGKSKFGRTGYWLFRKTNEPEGQGEFFYMLFCEKDVKSKAEPEPTYEELKLRLENRYMFFAGINRYSKGGIRDRHGIYYSIEKAAQEGEKFLKSMLISGYGKYECWWHVYDIVTNKIVRQS